jgi:hypothetical protein
MRNPSILSHISPDIAGCFSLCEKADTGYEKVAVEQQRGETERLMSKIIESADVAIC